MSAFYGLLLWIIQKTDIESWHCLWSAQYYSCIQTFSSKKPSEGKLHRILWHFIHTAVPVLHPVAAVGCCNSSLYFAFDMFHVSPIIPWLADELSRNTLFINALLISSLHVLCSWRLLDRTDEGISVDFLSFSSPQISLRWLCRLAIAWCTSTSATGSYPLSSISAPRTWASVCPSTSPATRCSPTWSLTWPICGRGISCTPWAMRMFTSITLTLWESRWGSLVVFCSCSRFHLSCLRKDFYGRL